MGGAFFNIFMIRNPWALGIFLLILSPSMLIGICFILYNLCNLKLCQFYYSQTLFVDGAQHLNGHTLIALKRLMDANVDGGKFSVILAGHPKLRNDLCRLMLSETD